eukprot:m.144634 g.144634  ORF g.144634 m.144634 type:complete len:302 (+) comp14133_c0_seq7:65-970(+)
MSTSPLSTGEVTSKVRPFQERADELSVAQGGRGVTAGWVKCPLCAAKSQKRFAYGKGFKAHLMNIHPDADHAEAIASAKPSAPGLTRTLKRQHPHADKMPPACVAAKEGRLAELKQMSGSMLNARDRHNASALDWAAGEGHVDVVRYLLLHVGVKGSRKSARHGKTPLHWACRNSRQDVAQVLLEHDPSLLLEPAGDGTLPIHTCAYNGTRAMLEYMDTLGVDWRQKNNWDCTVEHFACLRQPPNKEALVFFRDKFGDEEFSQHVFSARNREGVCPWDKFARRLDPHIKPSLDALLAASNT